MDTDTDDNLDLEKRVKYLEKKLVDVIATYEQTVAYLDSRISNLAGKVTRLELENLKERLGDVEDLESLSRLCSTNFRIAFNRIGRLERGERVNDIGWNIEGEDIIDILPSLNRNDYNEGFQSITTSVSVS